jgi:hypothetical protein
MTKFSHSDFNRAFTPGSIFRWSGGDTAISSLIDAGQLVLPSGGVIACDPGLMAGHPALTPFEPACPPGSYPVSLAVLTFQDDDIARQRVACARLQLSAAPVARWEPALRAGQDQSTLAIGQFFGFDVDTGLGCLLDFTALNEIWKQPGKDFYSATILPALPADARQLAWSNISTDEKSGANVIVYASGFGDGSYASYWGFDAQGHRCCLVTDFDLLTEPLIERFQVPLSQAVAQSIQHPALTEIGVTLETTQAGDELHIAIRGQTPGLCGVKLTSSEGEHYARRSHISDLEYRHIYQLQPDLIARMTMEIDCVVGTRPL